MRAAVHKGLTQAKILDESRALVDAGGPAALTMRALAARLGVAAMAIYNHFEDRDAILDAMANGLFEELRQEATEAGARTRRTVGWKRRLRNLLMKAQQLAASHPHLFRMAMTRPRKPASAFALASDSIQILEEAGLNRTQSLTAYHAFVILLQGYPFWQEGAERYGEELCSPVTFLPPGWDTERQFEAVVDWLLECVAQMGGKQQGKSVRRASPANASSHR
jgi:AcrR family transcriptional regulator